MCCTTCTGPQPITFEFVCVEVAAAGSRQSPPHSLSQEDAKLGDRQEHGAAKCDVTCLALPCCASCQACYGIEAVPEGEWLCWPCTDYEAGLRKQGQSQATIRPPRWGVSGAGLAGWLAGWNLFDWGGCMHVQPWPQLGPQVAVGS